MEIVICLPGKSFGSLFLTRWTDLLCALYGRGIRFRYITGHVAGVYEVRNLLLGHVGKDPYDYMLWIDSDIIFSAGQVLHLLDTAVENCFPILSGLYRIDKMVDAYTVVENYDVPAILETGSFTFMTQARAAEINGVCEVMHSNLGFTVVKQGVFEKFGYPWLRPDAVPMGEGKIYTTEDTYFGMLARQLGFLPRVDTRVIVGHEKSTILY